MRQIRIVIPVNPGIVLTHIAALRNGNNLRS